MAVAVTSLRGLAATVRGRRLDRELTQADVAAQAGVSRAWVSEFERGKPTAELGLVLRLFDALELDLVVRARDHAEPGQREAGNQGVDLDSLLDDYRPS